MNKAITRRTATIYCTAPQGYGCIKCEMTFNSDLVLHEDEEKLVLMQEGTEETDTVYKTLDAFEFAYLAEYDRALALLHERLMHTFNQAKVYRAETKK